MIGWRCNVKFVDISFVPDNIDPKSIQYDDNETLFPIYPELLNGGNEILGGRNGGELFAQLEGIIGETVYKIYCFPMSMLGARYDNITSFVPSIPLIYPNTYDSASSLNGRIFIYFPQLQKAVLVNNIDGYDNVKVYDTKTGKCVLIYNGSQITTGFNCLNNNYSEPYFTGGIIGFFGDFSQESFDVNSNYSILQISRSSDSRNPYIFNFIHPVDHNDIGPAFKALFLDYVDPDWKENTNPYEPGGSSGEGGGGGSFDDESDIITIPPLPTISSADTGFTRIYNPTLAQVQDLAKYLWTEESVIETIWNHIKQYFENPMEAIIGFNLVPVSVPNGGTTTFKLMYIDTGVSMTAAANQFVDVDCGTLELKEYYASALDYSPFTKISCFLPYIGNISLNVDEVMGRTLGVKYRVDICSGACVAYITVDGNAIYQYSGHCAIPIPISAADFSNYVTATISTAKLAAAGITAGVGVAAGMMVEDPSPQTNQIVKVTKQVQTARNPATGRQITTGTTTTTVEKPTEQDNTNASFAGLAPQNIANTVGTIMGSKPHIEHSGSFSGNSGYLGVRRPFVIIQRPNMCMPSNYQQLNGYPSMITMALSDCKGFTRVQQVQLTGFHATNPEQAEIMQLLKTGVIL